MPHLWHFDSLLENCYLAVGLPGTSRGADGRSLHLESLNVIKGAT